MMPVGVHGCADESTLKRMFAIGPLPIGKFLPGGAAASKHSRLSVPTMPESSRPLVLGTSSTPVAVNILPPKLISNLNPVTGTVLLSHTVTGTPTAPGAADWSMISAEFSIGWDSLSKEKKRTAKQEIRYAILLFMLRDPSYNSL
jgi:hypothetical protein